jgi:glycosyltransferase involved in cell wall biosynthesis
MRVAHVITRLVVGGAQENTVASVLGLRQKPGLEVKLISGPTFGSEGSLEPVLADYPGLLTIIPELVRPIQPWKDWLAWRKLTQLFLSERPEIVHTHSGKAGVLGRLAAARAKVPIIIHHIHGPSFGPFQGALANRFFIAAERAAGKVTSHFVCSANAMARRYLSAGIGKPEMYTRVFSGFQMEPFLSARNDPALRASLGLTHDAFVIGKIARLAPLKGHEDLFAAAQALLPRVPDARLLIVGDGSCRAELETKARASELAGKVIFTGLVPPAEVARYLGIMDCLVHLSAREALSRALPQALAAGKPVIAYDFDGADEVCLHQETGFLLRTGDIPGVSARLMQLAEDPGLRSRLGKRGQDLVKETFRVERMIEDLHQLYLRLAAEKSVAA